MFRRLFTSALAAGFTAGLIISVIQAFTTTPLILHAEQFEEEAAANPAAFADPDGAYPQPASFSPASDSGRFIAVHSDDHGHAGDGEAAWAPKNGLERTLSTTLINVLTGIGFALLLVAGFALHGKPVDGRQGVLWGMAGFAVFTLAPALGLPPEVPGSLAAEVGARQGWWVFTVIATGAGLGLMVFGKRVALNVMGVVFVALPHLVGAPHPPEFGGSAPPELAGQFAATAIVVGAVFWALLGWLSGTIYRRLDASANPARPI